MTIHVMVMLLGMGASEVSSVADPIVDSETYARVGFSESAYNRTGTEESTYQRGTATETTYARP